LNGLDAKLWNEVIKFELYFIGKNKTWNIKSLPPKCTTIKSKWLFKIKLHANGTIEKYKAHLVARGFSQLDIIN
jgi:hypothetical protein